MVDHVMMKPLDVAREAGVSLATLYAHLRSAWPPAYRIGTTGRGNWHIRRYNLEQWLQTLRYADLTPPAPSPPPASPASPFSELDPERLRRARKG